MSQTVRAGACPKHGRSALGRVGDPEADIGPVVAFLASDGGGYITGQTIVCDGGSFSGL